MTTDDTTTTDEPTDEQPDSEISPGDVVADREGSGKLVVVAETENTAERHMVAAAAQTVAELNEDYPADDPVYLCVYKDRLEEAFGNADWREVPATYLAFKAGDFAIPTYSFPVSRLAPTLEAEGDAAADGGEV